MRIGTVFFAVVLGFLAVASPCLARCGDGPADEQAVAAARAQVASDCNCAGSRSHGEDVRCAAGIAKLRSADGRLPRACRVAVVRCAERSTCGRPGVVACCRRRTPTARVECHLEPSAVCEARGGCAGAFASCCDACDAGGCATTTSTTMTTLPGCSLGGDGMCGGDCPSGELCVGRHPYVPTEPDCLCLPATEACANATWPFCGEVGHCPRPDDYCLDVATPPHGACTCITLP